MKRSFVSLSLAVAFAAGLAAPALAFDQNTPAWSAPTQIAARDSSSNLVSQHEMEATATSAYEHNINPLSVMRLASPYDTQDAFTGMDGRPLPGWEMGAGHPGTAGDGS